MERGEGGDAMLEKEHDTEFSLTHMRMRRHKRERDRE